MKRICLSVGASLLFVFATLSAMAIGREGEVHEGNCSATAERRLTELNVNRADIDRIVYSPV